MTLTASSGYKVCVAIYANYSFSSWTSSIALGTTREIPANTYYRVFIEKVDGSETDISTLLSAITIVRDSRIEHMASSVSALDGDISVNRSILSADGGMVLYFEKGSINTSGDSTYFADSRIRTGMLSFGADLIFSAKDSTLTNAFQVLTYNSDDTYKDSSGWVKTYSISRGTKFRIFASLTPNVNTLASVQEILGAFTYKFDFTTEFDPLPAYYFENDYLDGKISDIISYYALSPNLLTFGFITDTHMLVNAGQGFKLLKYIDERTNSIPFVIFGGDCIGHTQSKDDVYAQAGAWIDYMSDYDKRRVLQCRGNHDLLGDQNDSLLSRSERFMYLVRNQNMVAPSVNNFYYYYDVPYTNVRIIVIDDYDGAASGGAPKFTQTQIDWILNTALNTNNKNIVFITHNPADPDFGWYADNMEPLYLIMDALKTKSALDTTSREMVLSHDFTGDTNTLVCCLCGHEHNDVSHVDASGVLSIATNCDGNASSTSGYDRTVGTVNEQCFDVITIDTENRHIYMTRIGAGNNRDFSY